MIAMQYRIVLPADYDMGSIRQRIADKGHLLDDFPNLAFKAYLYADRTAAYAQGRENLYAPFYLWHNTEGMNAFLGSAGFSGVVASFGRPLVRTWSMWRADVASDLSGAERATREILPIAGTYLAGNVARGRKRQRTRRFGSRRSCGHQRLRSNRLDAASLPASARIHPATDR